MGRVAREERLELSRGAVKHVVRLGLLLVAFFFALSACDGGGGGAEVEGEQAKARTLPDYGDLRPGKFVTDEFEPVFSFEVVGKGWVVGGCEERTLVELRQGLRDRCSPSSAPSRCSTRARCAS